MRSETYMSKINLQWGKLTVENRNSTEKKMSHLRHIIVSVKYSRLRMLGTSPSLLWGRLPAVDQFPHRIQETRLAFWGTWRARRFYTWSSPGHWGVAPTTRSLEETLWTPTYQLAEGDWYWCTISQHLGPLSLEKASDRTLWRYIIDTAILCRGTRQRRHWRQRVQHAVSGRSIRHRAASWTRRPVVSIFTPVSFCVSTIYRLLWTCFSIQQLHRLVWRPCRCRRLSCARRKERIQSDLWTLRADIESEER